MHDRDAISADDLLQGRPERLDKEGFMPARIGHADG